MSRFEQSAAEQIDAEALHLITTEPVIVVSGQPLRVFGVAAPENDRFLEDCDPLVDELLFAPFSLFMQRIPRTGHSNHPEAFLSDEGYPAISGYNLSGDEVVMGIRESLGFHIKSEDK